MAESQNSNSSSSDKDSLISSEKTISGFMVNCDHKATDTDMASTDDGVECEQPLPSDEHGIDRSTIKTDEQEVTKPFHDEHRPKVESKQPKIIKNILMALKEEGKVRENSSPMRGNRLKVVGVTSQKTNTEALPKAPKPSVVPSGFKSNIDTSTVPAKGNCDSVKRIPGSHPLKHQVKIF